MKKLGLFAAASIVLVPALMLATGGQGSNGYSGDADYRVFCASCHGTDAKGDGPIGKSLKKRPPDLTLLSQRNDGVFPAERVTKIVDGRESVEAHSRSDMPAWGEVFAKSQDSQGPDAAKERIAAVVAYLKTIQAK